MSMGCEIFKGLEKWLNLRKKNILAPNYKMKAARWKLINLIECLQKHNITSMSQLQLYALNCSINYIYCRIWVDFNWPDMLYTQSSQE